ncbi:PREDICTED: girdin-like [Branchiostoma belcheri]|uniref:Girdin-like n=1 Tax=Branchiostoma belcheri TaxID=7741 RepID=A0A6P4ZL74_BRABE|nr:PREDICTED: girdin-like [Branchiostoma belcheri]
MRQGIIVLVLFLLCLVLLVTISGWRMGRRGRQKFWACETMPKIQSGRPAHDECCKRCPDYQKSTYHDGDDQFDASGPQCKKERRIHLWSESVVIVTHYGLSCHGGLLQDNVICKSCIPDERSTYHDAEDQLVRLIHYHRLMRYTGNDEWHSPRLQLQRPSTKASMDNLDPMYNIDLFQGHRSTTKVSMDHLDPMHNVNMLTLIGTMYMYQHLEALRKELDAIQQTIALRKDLDPIYKTLQALTNDLDQIYQMVEALRNDPDSTNQSSRTLEALRNDLDPINQMLKAVRMDLDSIYLFVMIKALRKEVDTIHQTLKALRKELDSIHQTVEALRKELDPIYQMCKALTNDLDPIYQTLKVLRKELDPIHQTVEALRKELDPIHQTLKALRIELDPIHQTVEALRKDLDPIYQTLKALRIELDPIHQTVEALRKEQDPIHQTLKALRKELDPIHQTVEALRKDLDPIYQTLKALRIELDPIHQTVEALRKELDPIHQTVEALRKALDPIYQTVEALMNDLDSTKQSYRTLEAYRNDLEPTNQILKASKKDLDPIYQIQAVNNKDTIHHTIEPLMAAEDPTPYTLEALKNDIHQIQNMTALKKDQDTNHTPDTMMKELKAQIHIYLEQIRDDMSHHAVRDKVRHTHKGPHRAYVTHTDLRGWRLAVVVQGACLFFMIALLSASHCKVRKGQPHDSSQVCKENPRVIEEETLVKDASVKMASETVGPQDTFVKGTALLFQQAVQAVDFANYGVQFGLSDHEIHHIVNTEAVTLQEQAAKKYEAWNRDGKMGEESHLRDDIVAERIQQLPRMLSQYKRE